LLQILSFSGLLTSSFSHIFLPLGTSIILYWENIALRTAHFSKSTLIGRILYVAPHKTVTSP
jgi:hypothetical protein